MPKLTQDIQNRVAAELRRLEAVRDDLYKRLGHVNSNIQLLQQLQRQRPPAKTKRAPAKKPAPAK